MDEKLVKYIPNIFTITRIIFVLLTFYLIINGFYLISIILVVLASITDFLDGYFARALNAESKLGAKLDQTADKLFSYLLSVALIISGNYFLIATLLIEVVFMVFMLIKSFKFKHWSITTKQGKIKTALLFITVALAIFYLMIDALKIPFIVLWSIATIYQAYSDYIIYQKFTQIKPEEKKN